MFTLPPWIINTLPMIINGIFEVIKGKQHSESLSKTEGITENSSAEDVENVVNIFSDYKKEVYKKTDEIEKIFEKELEAYKEGLMGTLEEKNGILKRYGIKPERLEKEIKRLGQDIRGSIDKEISKKISLDNNECREIMRMISGNQKEERFSAFFGDTIKIALDHFCEEFKMILEEFYSETEEEILEAVEKVQNEYEQSALDFSAVNAENYRIKSLDVQKGACIILSGCDVIDNIMEEIGDGTF